MFFFLICLVILLFNLDLFYFTEEFLIFLLLLTLFYALFRFFKKILNFYFFNQAETTYFLFIYLIRSNICVYSKLYNMLVFDHYFYYFYSFFVLRTLFLQSVSKLNVNFYLRVNKYVKSISAYLLSGFFRFLLWQMHYVNIILQHFDRWSFLPFLLRIYIILFIRHEIYLDFSSTLLGKNVSHHFFSIID